MLTAVVTWPVAAIWITVIVAVTVCVVALVRAGYGVDVKFRDPDERNE